MLQAAQGYSKAVALTVGTPIADVVGPEQSPVRGILITATVAGNVALVLDDGTVVTVAVAVGSVILALAVVEVNTSGTTATANYWALA